MRFRTEHQLRTEICDLWWFLDKEREYSSRLQSQIDELMFEYCPDEMTEEQIERYEKYQKAVD